MTFYGKINSVKIGRSCWRVQFVLERSNIDGIRFIAIS